MDEWVNFLKSKAYSFEGSVKKENTENSSKSQSENKKFEEYYIYLIGGDYQEKCDSYIIKSVNHGMYFQTVHYSMFLMRNVVI